MLAERRFFFMDILKEGYLLHDSGRYKLARPPKALPPELMLKHAQEYFEEWVHSADEFFIDFGNALDRKSYKNAAFYLHQSAERYITCLLLVHTGYRPKEHDMEKLLRQAAGFDQRFSGIFPNDTHEEKHLFELIRRAYVDARYSKSYNISAKELKAIAKRIERLKALTEEVCTNKISTLKEAAGT
ncbi:MAG: HEPN domain-containing protein [Candidatus Thiodiazotropha sp.]